MTGSELHILILLLSLEGKNFKNKPKLTKPERILHHLHESSKPIIRKRSLFFIEEEE